MFQKNMFPTKMMPVNVHVGTARTATQQRLFLLTAFPCNNVKVYWYVYGRVFIIRELTTFLIAEGRIRVKRVPLLKLYVGFLKRPLVSERVIP